MRNGRSKFPKRALKFETARVTLSTLSALTETHTKVKYGIFSLKAFPN